VSTIDVIQTVLLVLVILGLLLHDHPVYWIRRR
jgi:hypothetical protein